MAAASPNADGPCCAHSGATPGARQTLDEMDFERERKAQANCQNDTGAVCQSVYKSLGFGRNQGSSAQTATSPFFRTERAAEVEQQRGGPSEGMAFDSGLSPQAAEKGHADICSLLLQHSPALKAVRDRKSRLACDLLPCNSDLRDLLAG
ncbi:PREDICTED: ankyrin repeat domain-containing protein 39 [Hipposideros armiger]|uniref:Ankyrin repeat domain-containing protein 39 n=1 Tax=Hipposideros armiger TaxID=186990 RepID=A0A8B7SQ74_HIPAR|nr:PREDICTED: ankyrin repeat domain-containing protein 39 [Hipposideros armiger]